MATFPSDQFDTLRDDVQRTGAHRGPRVRGHAWVAFAWAALATGILVVIGLFVLSSLDSSFKINFPTAGAGASMVPTATPTPTVKPITDPTSIASRKITITILNGTATNGLEDKARTKLTNAKWTVGTVGPSSSTDVKQTVVYYASASNKDVAEGIQLALGAGTIEFSDAYVGSPVTVVLGDDFKG